MLSYLAEKSKVHSALLKKSGQDDQTSLKFSWFNLFILVCIATQNEITGGVFIFVLKAVDLTKQFIANITEFKNIFIYSIFI